MPTTTFIQKHILSFCLACLLSGCAFGALNANVPPAPTFDPALPFPIPASCPQSSFVNASALPEVMRQTASSVTGALWIGGAALAVGHSGGAAWRSGASAVTWWSAEGQPSIEANLLEGKSAPATLTFQNVTPPLYPSTLVLPQNGCWEIIGTAGAQRLRFIVYLYPARFVP